MHVLHRQISKGLCGITEFTIKTTTFEDLNKSVPPKLIGSNIKLY